MNRAAIIFQVFFKSIFKPKMMKDLIEERKQTEKNEVHKIHKYEYDFISIEKFFTKIFPNYDYKKYESEFIVLETHIEKFFQKLELYKYPSENKPYPINYSINSDSRKFLYHLCRAYKPEKIVETGVAYGISSTYILKALHDNEFGMLYSIDSVFRPWQTEKMIGSVIPDMLRTRWNLVLGKSMEKLYNLLNKLNDVDIFIHDSSHTYDNMIFEFSIALDKINKNGIIISDDILSNDAFYDFTKNKKLENYVIKVQENSGLGIIRKI